MADTDLPTEITREQRNAVIEMLGFPLGGGITSITLGLRSVKVVSIARTAAGSAVVGDDNDVARNVTHIPVVG